MALWQVKFALKLKLREQKTTQSTDNIHTFFKMFFGGNKICLKAVFIYFPN